MNLVQNRLTCLCAVRMYIIMWNLLLKMAWTLSFIFMMRTVLQTLTKVYVENFSWYNIDDISLLITSFRAEPGKEKPDTPLGNRHKIQQNAKGKQAESAKIVRNFNLSFPKMGGTVRNKLARWCKSFKHFEILFDYTITVHRNICWHKNNSLWRRRGRPSFQTYKSFWMLREILSPSQLRWKHFSSKWTRR